MDDLRLPSVLFLAGFASLTMPGCGGDGEPGVAPNVGPPGNPLAGDRGLTGGDGGGSSSACDDYAAKIAECSGYSAQEYAAACEYYLAEASAYGGPGCAAALQELFACLSELSCQGFGDEDACELEDLLGGDACGGGGGGGGSGGGGGNQGGSTG